MQVLLFSSHVHQYIGSHQMQNDETLIFCLQSASDSCQLYRKSLKEKEKIWQCKLCGPQSFETYISVLHKILTDREFETPVLRSLYTKFKRRNIAKAGLPPQGVKSSPPFHHSFLHLNQVTSSPSHRLPLSHESPPRGPF